MVYARDTRRLGGTSLIPYFSYVCCESTSAGQPLRVGDRGGQLVMSDILQGWRDL